METTDRKRAKKLLELGYEGEPNNFWFYCTECKEFETDRFTKTNITGDTYHCCECGTELEMVDYYSADTLFDWLRENFWEPDVKFFEIQEDGIYLARFDDSWSAWVEYKDSLTNMLADAIIKILEQEKVK